MSLFVSKELRQIATLRARELRKSSTYAEDVLWSVLRNRGLLNKKVYRQKPLFYSSMGKISFFIADFYYHESKLVIEVDGKIHAFQKEQDARRTEIINEQGIRVVRFKNEDVLNNINSVLEEIKDYISK